MIQGALFAPSTLEGRAPDGSSRNGSGPLRRIAAVKTLAALAVLALAGAAGIAAVAYVHNRDPYRNLPVYATAPTSAAAAVVAATNGVCVSSDGLGDPPVSAHLWVDPNPSGAKALWLPGLNARPCRAILIDLSPNQARSFAKAVETSRPYPPGIFNCPADDASSVTVFLSYPDHRQAEVVQVRLAGCGGMTAPGRDFREPGGIGLQALGPFPPGWR